ncbi:MAG TPA: hypothetical protein VKS21_08905, partial [Spirochaetota bacterium]|nr:hypothetical protein [Spirochaetota bacterium]
LSFSESLPVTYSGTNLLLVMNLADSATADNSFSISFDPSQQQGFDELSILDTRYYYFYTNIVTTDSNIITTPEMEIRPKVQESDVRDNIIYTADGNTASIKVDSDAEVLIYDILGVRMGKLSETGISGGWASWDGKIDGSYVPSGVYILCVKKGDKITKYEQILVEKNK